MKKLLFLSSACLFLAGGIKTTPATPILVTQDPAATTPAQPTQLQLITAGTEPRQQLRLKPQAIAVRIEVRTSV